MYSLKRTITFPNMGGQFNLRGNMPEKTNLTVKSTETLTSVKNPLM